MRLSGRPGRIPRILTTLMLVFLAGAATGALSMRSACTKSCIRHGSRLPQSALQSRRGDATASRPRLDLSGPQVQKLGLVLDDYSQYYESLQEQLDDLRSTGKTRIMQILNPDQRVKFEKMMTDLAPQLTGGKQ